MKLDSTGDRAKFLLRFEVNRSRVDAVAHTSHVWRSIGKQMSEMCAARFANDFCSGHSIAVIDFLFDVRGSFCKCRPTAKGVKFVVRFEEFLAADDAVVFAIFKKLVVDAFFRRFSSSFNCHFIQTFFKIFSIFKILKFFF